MRIIKLRLEAEDQATAQAALDEWRHWYGERLQHARGPRPGRKGGWLVYAEAVLDLLKP